MFNIDMKDTTSKIRIVGILSFALCACAVNKAIQATEGIDDINSDDCAKAIMNSVIGLTSLASIIFSLKIITVPTIMKIVESRNYGYVGRTVMVSVVFFAGILLPQSPAFAIDLLRSSDPRNTQSWQAARFIGHVLIAGFSCGVGAACSYLANYGFFSNSSTQERSIQAENREFEAPHRTVA